MRVVGKFLVALCVLVAVNLASVAPSFAAPSASEVVKEFYAALETAMKEGPTLGFDGRYKKLEPAVTKAFNLPLMAKYAVGPSWSKVAPEDQQNWSRLFRNSPSRPTPAALQNMMANNSSSRAKSRCPTPQGPWCKQS